MVFRILSHLNSKTGILPVEMDCPFDLLRIDEMPILLFNT